MSDIGIGHNSDSAIVARDTLDEQQAPLLTLVRDACRYVAPDTITEHAEASAITARIGTLNSLGKKIDEAHKAAKAPHLAAGRACDGWREDARRNLDALKARLSAVLTDFQRGMAEQERKRREQEAEAARQYADMSGDKRADYLASSLEADAAKPDADMSKVRSRTGALASLRTVWDFEIEDRALVPRDLCSPDEKLIRAAIAAGRAKIPGVRIFQRQLTVVR